MKIISVFAAAFLSVCAIAGGAVAGPQAIAPASDDQTGSINSVQRNFSSSRVYCFVGATGDLAHLHRGWVCIQESLPESS